ncbi:MAG TPA: alpha/beta hydrolase [Acidimicrobiia bacterium]|nr:alpha/beta hydrolase [Acidimicrobiia bacterium]
MSAVERVAYDEFGLFHENAEEYGLPYDSPPVVRREEVEVEPGRTLSALVWGEGEPELVFLHGGSQNAHTWDTVAMALRPRPLIAIDLPGHGHSARPGDQQVSGAGPRAAATDVAVVVRALAPNAHGVVGMSMGGLTTLALADQNPELVRRMILVDVFPGLKAEHARHIGEFVNGPATFPKFEDILERTMQFNPTRSESSMRRGILHNAVQLDDGSWVWRHSRWRVENPEVAEQYEQQRAAAAEAQAEQSEGETPTDTGLFDDLLEAARGIQVPTLLARGMRPDSVLRDDDEAAFLETVSGGEVERFEEAGHSIQGDMPIELAATISRFIP